MQTFSDFNDFSDFPYAKKFDRATVYSKNEFYKREFRDLSEDIEDDELEKFDIDKDTRIGILSAYEDDVDTIVIFTKDSYFYGHEDSMTTDDINIFELEDGIHYVPAQEPVDLIESDYENGGGSELEHKVKLKSITKKYKLDHFLISV